MLFNFSSLYDIRSSQKKFRPESSNRGRASRVEGLAALSPVNYNIFVRVSSSCINKWAKFLIQV